MKDIIRILRVGGSLWRSYAWISVFTVLLSLITILQPLLSGWAIDEIQKGSQANITHAFLFAVGIFVLDLMQTGFSNISGYIGDMIQVKLNKLLSENYYRHLMSLPQKYFDNEQTGKIISRLNRSIVQVTGFIHMMSNNFLQFIVSTILSLGIVLFISWPVGLMLASLYPIFIWMTVRTSNVWMGYQSKKNEHFDIANGRFSEAVSQVKVVKSFMQQERELGFFSRQFQGAFKQTVPQSRFWHLQDVRRRLILNIIFFAVYGYIFVRGAQGDFTTGQVVTLILYAMNIRIPIFSISYLVENTQRAVSDSRDYFEAMNEKPEIDASETELKVQKGAITFNALSFGYTKTKQIMHDISFDIKPGQKVALVGESGEGKTTLTNLLLRLYEPSSGTIEIDGTDISAVSKASLRSNIGVVFQEPNLFSGTIQENISYADASASEKSIQHAAKAANAHEFITGFEEGYNSEIGERGLKLSGGQKQRIAIARAIQKDAPILVLDEATSSLDSRSELLVQEALERLMKNRTTIIIAHRLSTIQNVDLIVALKGGRVAEVGSPRELAKSNGIYAKLLQVQTARSAEERQEALAKFGIVS